MSYKQSRDMSSNISIRSRAKNRGLVVNDISFAFKGGGQLPTIPVTYSDNELLNVPSIALEDLPTDSHKADSDFQDAYDGLASLIENQISRETTKSQTPKQKAEEQNEKE